MRGLEDEKVTHRRKRRGSDEVDQDGREDESRRRRLGDDLDGPVIAPKNDEYGHTAEEQREPQEWNVEPERLSGEVVQHRRRRYEPSGLSHRTLEQRRGEDVP